MSKSPTEHPETQSRWLWPLLLVSVAIILSVMIYSQRFVSKVDSIEKQQAPQFEARKFLLTQPDVINTNWMRTLDPIAKKVYGDVVWSTLMQQGILRFANLPALQPNETYHLWMHDLANSPNDPVSVLKFSPEVTMPTELLVPFKPSRVVKEPYMFTIMLDNSSDDIPPQPLLLAQP